MKKYPFIGIDIGKAGLHVCYPEGDDPRSWPVMEFEYKTNTDWHWRLSEMLQPQAIIAYEPTGSHLSAPVTNVLLHFAQEPQIWLIGHGTTGKIRETFISTAKTDVLDARSLCLAAQMIRRGERIERSRRYDPGMEEQVQYLRALVNERSRARKTTTRLKNRLHSFAHAMHPLLNIRFGVWIQLAMEGWITPKQIIEWKAQLPEDRDRRVTNFKEKLAEQLPEIDVPQFAAVNAADTIQQLDEAEARAQILEAEIRLIVTSPPFDVVTYRVLRLPGSGGDPLRVAPYHVACHGQLENMTPDEVKSAIGIAATTSTSGSINKTRAKKGGYKPAMTDLFMWTNQLLTPSAGENPIKTYFDGLKARGKKYPGRAARAKLARMISGAARNTEHD